MRLRCPGDLKMTCLIFWTFFIAVNGVYSVALKEQQRTTQLLVPLTQISEVMKRLWNIHCTRSKDIISDYDALVTFKSAG